MKIVWQGHDESVIEVPKHACRHCKQEESAHQERKCLFEPTTFDPMTPEEHARWLLELAGSQHIREKLRESGLFRTEYLGQFPTRKELDEAEEQESLRRRRSGVSAPPGIPRSVDQD